MEVVVRDVPLDLVAVAELTRVDAVVVGVVE